MWANTVRTVLTDVALPIGVYLGLTAVGIRPVWALIGSAAVSVLNLVVSWLRTKEVSTLGLLVLVQFGLGVAVAGITGDPRLVLLKDYAVTSVIALAAAGTLALRRPFIARIRRDLSPDPAEFDRRWEQDRAFRQVHSRLTVMWVVGLLAQAGVAALVIYTTSLTTAVITTNVLTPAVLLTLITVTQVRASRVPERQDVPPARHE